MLGANIGTHPVPLQTALTDSTGRMSKIWANWAMEVNRAFADSETPTGEFDEHNRIFTLEHTPEPAASLQLFLSGSLQRQGVDYTLAGRTITYDTAPAEQAWHLAWYRY